MIYPKEVIIAYIEKYITDDWSLTEGSKWINIDSIFTKDTKKKLGFNYETNLVNDFKMGQNWKLEDFVAEHQEISLKSAKGLLFRLAMDLKKNKNFSFTPIVREKYHVEEAVELESIRDYLIPPSKNFGDTFSDLNRKATTFIKKRGITSDHIKKFNLTYVDQKRCWHCDGEDEDCPVCKGKGYNPYYGRIIIPTYENKKLVYFQARDFLDKELRYRNPSMERRHVVSFYDLLKENDRIIIAEGPFDSMTLLNYNSTCMMGAQLTDSQILKILQKHPKEIVVAPDFDPDAETRKRIMVQLDKNIQKLIKFSENKIDIFVYEWYKIPEVKDRLIEQFRKPYLYEDDLKKDINDFQINEVHDTYLKNVSDIYSKLRTKLQEIQ